MFAIAHQLPAATLPAGPRRRVLRVRPMPRLTPVSIRAADGTPTGRLAWLPLAPDAYRIVVVEVDSP